MVSLGEQLYTALLIPQHFRGTSSRVFLDVAPDYPAYAAALYLLAVFYLPGHLAKHKKTYELKWIVAGWNLFLSVVSFTGTFYTTHMIYELVSARGIYGVACYPNDITDFTVLPSDLLLPDPIAPNGDHTVGNNHFFNCNHSLYVSAFSKTDDGPVFPPKPFDPSNIHHCNTNIGTYHTTVLSANFSGPQAFYVALFMYLKTPELLDTVFLILQGKPVSFLHWYHHIVTALYCWHASYVLIPSGLFFATMNYCVHSIMYLYYFLVMMGLRMKIRPFAPCITVLQCLQMFIGMGITVYTYLQHWLGPNKQTTYFYMFFNAVFATAHYLWHQACSLLSTGTSTTKDSMPALHMEDYFGGCHTDTTNMRMGMMMYGSYCVLFVVLFKELYLDKRVKKRSLVLARKEQAKANIKGVASAPDMCVWGQGEEQ